MVDNNGEPEIIWLSEDGHDSIVWTKDGGFFFRDRFVSHEPLQSLAVLKTKLIIIGRQDVIEELIKENILKE
jgi:hypothetical protein